jgi:hypothetical protein
MLAVDIVVQLFGQPLLARDDVLLTALLTQAKCFEALISLMLHNELDCIRSAQSVAGA